MAVSDGQIANTVDWLLAPEAVQVRLLILLRYDLLRYDTSEILMNRVDEQSK
jgi:hypothetical protein